MKVGLSQLFDNLGAWGLPENWIVLAVTGRLEWSKLPSRFADFTGATELSQPLDLFARYDCFESLKGKFYDLHRYLSKPHHTTKVHSDSEIENFSIEIDPTFASEGGADGEEASAAP